LCLLPFLGFANDPTIENKDEAEKKQADSKEVKAAAAETKKEEPAKTQEGLSKDAVITNSTKIEENKSTDDNSLSKFNYLFYFIYKHKYQEINKLEEKL